MSRWQLSVTVVMGAFTAYQAALLVRFLLAAEARSRDAEQHAQRRLSALRRALWRSGSNAKQRAA